MRTDATSTTSSFLTSHDLQHFIDAHQIRATILPMAEHTPTVSDAARELAVETDQIIKSLVFRIGDQPLLVISNGNARVDRKKLATILGVGRNRIKFASPDAALEITGYVVGSMPPFGHRSRLRTLIDREVTRQAVIFGGGGDVDAMLRLTPDELLRVSGGELAEISE